SSPGRHRLLPHRARLRSVRRGDILASNSGDRLFQRNRSRLELSHRGLGCRDELWEFPALTCHRLCAAFALLLVAFWTAPSSGQRPSGEVWLKADFGAIGDGTSDDTAAVHAFLAACETAACRMEPGRYRVTAAPKQMNYPINLEGAGIDTSEFIR